MPVLAPLLVVSTLAAAEAVGPWPLDGEIEVEPTDVRYIEAHYPETVIRGRPWIPHRRMATVRAGTRLVVSGMVDSRDDAGCQGKPWYAVYPFGFVCSRHARPTDQPPEPGHALPVDPGDRLPFAYAIVRADGTPMYASVEDARMNMIDRELTKGMSLSIDRGLTIDGLRYLQTTDGKIVPKPLVGWLGQGSEWQGVAIDYRREGPGPMFAWVARRTAQVREQPDKDAPVVRSLDHRERVPLLESRKRGERVQWWRIGPRAWVDADRLNAAVAIDPPADVVHPFRVQTTGNDQWIDIDTGQQVLVAYRGRRPVYATLVSSGRSFPTPRGNYPMWAKVAAMDMANQEYEDNPYLVEDVPWVVLFQGHNALHGAYWHNRFGHRKSHGCVNLAPLDARWVFQWTAPRFPRGFTGYLPHDLDRSPVVHVRDTSKPPGQQFTQQRPVGPPDPEEEQRKREEAEARRALTLADQDVAQAEARTDRPTAVRLESTGAPLLLWPGTLPDAAGSDTASEPATDTTETTETDRLWPPPGHAPRDDERPSQPAEGGRSPPPPKPEPKPKPDQ